MISDRPPRRDGMRVLKLGAGSRTEAIVAGKSVIWIGQHWMRRPQACLGPDACPACQWNQPRPIGFMAIMSRDGRSSLVEVSPNAFERFCGLLGLESAGPITDPLGVVVSISRRGRKTPLVLEPTDERVMVAEVSKQRILAVVALLYGWPSPVEGESEDAYERRVFEIARPKLQSAVDAEKYLAARQ